MIRAALLVAALTLLLAACGKVGPNSPPGPDSAVTYHKFPYPAE